MSINEGKFVAVAQFAFGQVGVSGQHWAQICFSQKGHRVSSQPPLSGIRKERGAEQEAVAVDKCQSMLMNDARPQ